MVPENLLERIFARLTPERIWQLAEKHRLNPLGPEPWGKVRVAGSDDHGGLLIAEPHTVCPAANSIQELLSHIRSGQCAPAGHGGTALNVAHSIFAVAYQFARERKKQRDVLNSRLAWSFLDSIFGSGEKKFVLSWLSRFLLAVNGQYRWPFSEPSPAQLSGILFEILERDPFLQSILTSGIVFDRRTSERFFLSVNGLADRLLVHLLQQRDRAGLSEEAKSVILFLVLIIPYLASCKTEYGDRPLMREIRRTFTSDSPPPRALILTERPAQWLLRRPTFPSVIDREMEEGYAVEIWGLDDAPAIGEICSNYAALARVTVGGRSCSVPPVLQMAYRLVNGDYEKIILHDAGLVTPVGVLLAKLTRIPVVTIYPQHAICDIVKKSENERYSGLIRQIWGMMLRQMSEIRLRHPAALGSALALGCDRERIRYLRTSNLKSGALAAG